ncbi:hypothetical protein ACSSS7_000326 [Eimeria intestinalis]
MAKTSRSGLATRSGGPPNRGAPRKGAPKAAAAGARASSKDSGALQRKKKETALAAAAQGEQQQQQQRQEDQRLQQKKIKSKEVRLKKEKRAPLLKGPLIIPDFEGIVVGAPQAAEAPEAEGTLEGAPSSAAETQGRETVETEEKSKTHFWKDRKNRSVLRALQRRLEEGEDVAPHGPPSQELVLWRVALLRVSGGGPPMVAAGLTLLPRGPKKTLAGGPPPLVPGVAGASFFFGEHIQGPLVIFCTRSVIRSSKPSGALPSLYL